MEFKIRFETKVQVQIAMVELRKLIDDETVVTLETVDVESMSGNISKDYYIVLRKNESMKEKEDKGVCFTEKENQFLLHLFDAVLKATFANKMNLPRELVTIIGKMEVYARQKGWE